MSDTARAEPKTQIASSVATAVPHKTTFMRLKDCQTLDQAFATKDFMDRIAASVPQHVQPNRMLRTFVTAVSKTPLLAQASVRSFVGACLTLSQVGLEPNTPLGHAYLIPFKHKKGREETVEINVVFGYPGLLDLSFRTGLVRAVHADVVWPGDEFSFEYGSNAHVRHKPVGMSRQEGARPTFAYMHAVLKDGQAFEVMPYSEVLAIRDKSQAYRFALSLKADYEAKGWRTPAGYTEAPWVAHEIAMARKTVFRSGSKWLPRSVEVASVIALDEAQDRRRSMDFGAVLDAPSIDGKHDYLAAATDIAAGGDDPPPDEPPKTIATDPGSTFTDRRPREAVNDEIDRAVETAQQGSTSFEAVLIDASGDPLDAVYDDPVSFANDFLHMWEMTHEAEALREHNADALEDAKADPKAAAILAKMEVKQSVEPPIEVVVPPQDRGKVSWSGYNKLVKQSLQVQATTAERFRTWIDKQRPNLELCPTAQRVLLVRAIMDTAQRLAIAGDLPDWIAGLIRPVAPSTPAPSDAPEKTSDQRWVEARIKELAEIKERPMFDALLGSSAVKTVMARLRRENKALFDVADQAFSAKMGELYPSTDEGTQP